MAKGHKNQSNISENNRDRPNFLFIIVDEERFPTAYESDELKEWRRVHLKAQERLRENSMSFLNHYVGSTACSPSRTTLFTGHYPSLHGVTQTTGAAKGAFDSDVFWLDHNTVPTLGDYFRTAGYRTYWKGKWHISDEDILIPGTHNALSSYNKHTGVPDHKNEKIYSRANRLDAYGFSGWMGPEPHGTDPRNSGSSARIGLDGRDAIYAEEVVSLLKKLEEGHSKESEPWLIVSSFINPHDITLFGLLTQLLPTFDFKIDPSVPDITQAPTAGESLQTKPTAQESYRKTYQKALQPTLDTPFFRKLYYSLQKEVDNEVFKVLQALQKSIFNENTIIVYTSDHGDLLGSHGGLFQKWHNAYEESIHVPFLIHSPKLFTGKQQTTMLTSHVDVIPTLLSLANIPTEKAQAKLRKNHSEVHPFVGRDLTPLIHGNQEFSRANEALYFMTDDDFSRGLHQVSQKGESYESVTQPNHMETLITTLKTGENDSEEKWKLSRYFDNPQFWSTPDVEDLVNLKESTLSLSDATETTIKVSTTKTNPVPDQYELYNVTQDPFEEKNLAHPQFATPKTKIIQQKLIKTLEKQAQKKRLSPES
ncbi:sulfatase-like hydrolase/transferase [Oceanobacillus longus]|uniref:Sulfatase-like hydrolase/transferase n=1 Tax=Oceanobacillus longus TaxID=930120 RepID=A0ABV8GYG6_9BACI